VVQEILQELVAVLEDAFRCEEELMMYIDHPDALTHCRQHEHLPA
jgi:hemerythrin